MSRGSGFREGAATFGGIVFRIITFILAILPLVMLRQPWWVCFLLLVGTQIPFVCIPVNIAIYVWSFIVVVQGPIGALEIIYFIDIGVVVLYWLIVIIASLISDRGR